MILSNDSLNAFQYRLYKELQQSRLHTTYRRFLHYNYYRALFLSHFIGAVPFI